MPFFTHYRPQVSIRTVSLAGEVVLPDDVKMVTPGNKTQLLIDLNVNVAASIGDRITLSEGSQTVAAGTITETNPKRFLGFSRYYTNLNHRPI